TWGEAVRKHGLQTLLGLVWGAGVYWVDPFYLPWLLPITGALALSIPISVLSSRVSLGRRFRRAGLFVIPEEAHPPAELVATDAYVDATPPLPAFADVVVDPLANALVCASGIAHVGVPPQALAARDALADETLRAPPDALSPAHRLKVLNDPVLLSRLHLDVWSGAAAHEGWRRMTGRAPAAALPAAA
ncbi:MAG: glucans biosynthesis glucosyltransferase MdoH, partial [Burkholderiaceae bacterium]